jgi:two-component system response regulator VicR
MKETSMLSKTKILAVTRDPVLVNLLQQDLNDGSYEIINTRHSGMQLKDVIDAENPDFIIIDIVMPSLEGIGTCLQLRQWTQTPIMMLSTWDTGDGKFRGLNLGSDSYLTEPFGVDTLRSRIEDTLKRTVTTTTPMNTIRISRN